MAPCREGEGRLSVCFGRDAGPGLSRLPRRGRHRCHSLRRPAGCRPCRQGRRSGPRFLAAGNLAGRLVQGGGVAPAPTSAWILPARPPRERPMRPLSALPLSAVAACWWTRAQEEAAMAMSPSRPPKPPRKAGPGPRSFASAGHGCSSRPAGRRVREPWLVASPCGNRHKMPFETRRFSTRGTPRSLLGTSSARIDHSRPGQLVTAMRHQEPPCRKPPKHRPT